MAPESSFGLKERGQPKQRASYCDVTQRRQEDGNNGVFLRRSTPTPPSLWAHLQAGAKSPSGRSSDQSCPSFSGPPKMQGSKGQRSGKTFGKAKDISVSLVHRTPLQNKHKVQIHLPSGASPHLRNSMTHPQLLLRHWENKRQTDSVPQAQPFREQLACRFN